MIPAHHSPAFHVKHSRLRPSESKNLAVLPSAKIFPSLTATASTTVPGRSIALIVHCNDLAVVQDNVRKADDLRRNSLGCKRRSAEGENNQESKKLWRMKPPYRWLA